MENLEVKINHPSLSFIKTLEIAKANNYYMKVIIFKKSCRFFIDYTQKNNFKNREEESEYQKRTWNFIHHIPEDYILQ